MNAKLDTLITGQVNLNTEYIYKCSTIDIIKMMNTDFNDYLRDESRKVGSADTISFPQNEEEVCSIFAELSKQKTQITTQGARTGITAGAVPCGGHVLNLSRMNKIKALAFDEKTESFFITVESGLRLSDLRKSIESLNLETSTWVKESIAALARMKSMGRYFFSPDPTETSASLGGMAACNASGARSFQYGSIRNYVQAIRVVLADGSLIYLERGKQKAMKLNYCLETNSGKKIEGILPHYSMPLTKNASGYYCKENMDLIDLFIGSEGTLGVITELKLKLLKLPASIWGIMFFFTCEEDSLQFISSIRGKCTLAALEFFNNKALSLLKNQNTVRSSLRMQEIPEGFHTAVYAELHGADYSEVYELALKASNLYEECGGDKEWTWVAANKRDMDIIHAFRHSIPETVNSIIDQRRKIDPELTKLGTDMAVPDDELYSIMKTYNADLAQLGLESVIFGHIGDNHVHVNILPRNMNEYVIGKKLYQKWAKQVIRLGGSISAEHGVGKLKTVLLAEMYGESGIDEMKAVKKSFDPSNLLNTGNLFA